MDTNAEMSGEDRANRPPDFLNINSRTNAIDSLETAVGFLQRDDPFRWKWVAIAAHHALYSFCIAALENGNPHWVLSSGKRGKEDQGRFSKRGEELRSSKSRQVTFGSGPAYRIVWELADEEPYVCYDVREFSLPTGKEQLIGFWTALAGIQDERSIVHDVLSKPVALSDDDLRAIQWLALRARNEFIHFTPKFWSIEIEGIRSGFAAALRTIDALVFQSHTLWMMKDDDRARVRRAITSATSLLIAA